MNIWLPDSDRVEFRFWSDGDAIIIDSVSLEALLIDTGNEVAWQDFPDLPTLIKDYGDARSISKLIDLLVRSGDYNTARTVVSLGAADAAGVFNALNKPLRMLGSFEQELKGISLENAEFFSSRMPLQRYDVFDLNDASRIDLRARGYDPMCLQANVLLSQPQPFLSNIGKQRDLACADAALWPDLFRSLANVDFGFQYDILTGGGIAAYCPVTGQLLHSSHGFCVYHDAVPFGAYRFEGAETFYVLTGGFMNARQALYMAHTGTIIELLPPALRGYAIDRLVRSFVQLLLLNADIVHPYLARDTSPALTLHRANLGHLLWNDGGGVHAAYKHDMMRRVEDIIFINPQMIEFSKLFPELEGKKHKGFDNANEAFRYCIEARLVPVRLTEVVLEDDYEDRLRSAAETHASSDFPTPTEAPHPLFLINLRAHSKFWTNQIDGNANMLNALQLEYGGIGVFFDGLNDCQEIADSIRSKTSSDVTFYDGLGISMFDTLNWVFAVDAYSCVIGSGLVLAAWLAKKPGVAHAEHIHMAQLDWFHYARSGLPPIAAPQPDQIRSVGSGAYSNYEVDWKVVLDLLQRQLVNHAKPNNILAVELP